MIRSVFSRILVVGVLPGMGGLFGYFFGLLVGNERWMWVGLILGFSLFLLITSLGKRFFVRLAGARRVEANSPLAKSFRRFAGQPGELELWVSPNAMGFRQSTDCVGWATRFGPDLIFMSRNLGDTLNEAELHSIWSQEAQRLRDPQERFGLRTDQWQGSLMSALKWTRGRPDSFRFVWIRFAQLPIERILQTAQWLR